MSSKTEIKEFTIIAYPADCQVIDLQIKLPILLEYLHINNTSLCERDLETNLGDFTKGMYEIIPQDDDSVMIANNNGDLITNICLFLNTNGIDFKFTKLNYEQTVKFNDNEDVKYVLQFDENNLTSRITEKVLLDALQSHTKLDIPNKVLEYLVTTIDEPIDALRTRNHLTILEEDEGYFAPCQVLSRSGHEMVNRLLSK